MSLAVLAVALVQIFGMQSGFLCRCTGEVSDQAKCESAGCHSGQSEHLGLESCQGSEAMAGQPGHGQSQNDPRCEHNEIRGHMKVTVSPPVLKLPAALFFELPPAFQLLAFTEMVATYSEVERPAPLEYGSPPMPLMVAETIVMLV